MQIPVLVEPIAGNGYRARGGEPLALTAEGPTRDAALAELIKQLQARLQSGAEIVPVEVRTRPTSSSTSSWPGTIRWGTMRPATR